jgi:hypothetical protein
MNHFIVTGGRMGSTSKKVYLGLLNQVSSEVNLLPTMLFFKKLFTVSELLQKPQRINPTTRLLFHNPLRQRVVSTLSSNHFDAYLPAIVDFYLGSKVTLSSPTHPKIDLTGWSLAKLNRELNYSLDAVK